MAQRTNRSIDRLEIDVYVDEHGMLESMADDVRKGLSAEPRRLSPKYFYDDAGSELFEQITDLPEYYPTRAERALLEETADELMGTMRPQQIVELGSGSSAKTRVLLGVQSAPEYLTEYVPFDVSRGIVEEAAAGLLADFPYLSIHGVIGDFGHHLEKIPAATGKRLVLFLGGTIGNLDPTERTAFLSSVAELLGPEDRLLIGLDLVKDPATIEAAYNDSAGVTAAFNRNMLNVLNRGLSADFNPDAFQHHAFFNQDESRIEMHLVPKAPQMVSIRDLGMTITIDPSETIWTECSYKFTEESLRGMLADAGMQLDRFYTNDEPNELFGLVLAGPAD
jgi:L-histidine N-alpha-methyltransferase